ncbi:MAG: type I-C CRISPR-associated protein Cas5c [Mariprofundales bacterium]
MKDRDINKQRNRISLRVWGDFACFTRPEMKVERVSYPLLTPSAARGIFEAIYWEPQIYYLIDNIRVIKRGSWLSIRRNEVTNVISFGNAKQWMHAPEKVTHIRAGGGAAHGTQRNMLALQNVEYLITAEVRLTTLGNRVAEGLAKYLGEIKRRASCGKCFHRPALGMREFAADFELIEGKTEISSSNYSDELGLMLYDVFAPEARMHGFRWLRDGEHLADSHARLEKKNKRRAKTKQPRYEGRLVKPEPLFFHASVRNGYMECHPDKVSFVRNQMMVEV